MQMIHLVNIGIGGGQLRVAMEEISHLQRQGHPSILIEGFQIPHPYHYNAITTSYKLPLRFPKSIQGFTSPVLREISGQIGSIDIPKNFQPDWIICHSLGLIYDALKLRRRFGSKIAVLIHAITYPPSLFNFLFVLPFIKKRQLKLARRLLKKVDLVISTSQMTRKFVTDTYDIDSKVLYLGCDPATDIPDKRGDFILCAQRISLRKNVDLVAGIISSIDKNIPVIFAGSKHRTSKAVVREIKKTGLKNYEVLFNLDDDALRRLYLTCRMLLYVNREPFGMNQMEAASNGASVVANAGSGASELFISRTHGYFIKNVAGELPVEAYAKCVTELMADERKAWRMGHEAWDLCRTEYTWKKHVIKLLKFLNEYLT